MLVDPQLILERFDLVLVILLLIIVVKGIIVAGLVLLFGFRGKTAVLTGVALAQSGEFSFLLASVGTEAGILTEEAFSLLLLGAALSILISPFLYRACIPMGDWVERRLAPHRSGVALPPDRRLSAHAIILGYGRVGHVIEHALRTTGMGYVIVDQDQARVNAARRGGAYALAGSASNLSVLEAAGIERASLLTIAVPDPISARRIVDHAQRVNPDIDIVVRTHSQDERRFLEDRGVNEAVVGELELAIEMSRHALARFGLKAEDIERVLAGARAHGVDGF
jgi:CPA2 family monovalent cation:H+ antiporter-2